MDMLRCNITLAAISEDDDEPWHWCQDMALLTSFYCSNPGPVLSGHAVVEVGRETSYFTEFVGGVGIS